jgi:hypothetical protein
MGTSLTGTTPQDTYDSLIKVTDNGPLSGTLKTLTDGLGNDSALALSTGAASIAGTLDVVRNSGVYELIKIQNNTAGALYRAIGLGGGSVDFGADDTLASTAIFRTASTERMRITNAGVVELAQGQIKFPVTQVASADPNTLDDYEEGTWTMGLAFGGASVDIVYGNQTAYYTKIGRQVTVNGYMYLTNKGTSTGAATITGLPFTNRNVSLNYAPPTFGGVIGISFADQLFGFIGPNTTTIQLFETTNAGVQSSLTNADFTNTSEIQFSLTYIA